VADIQSNIQVNLDATQALAQLKALQRQLAQFHTSIAASTAAAARAQANLQDNLINSINATGKFSASLQQIKSTSEAFTDSLERNKFSTREYFRYAGGATKTFGRLFKTEFDTIGKVAEERVKTMQTQYVKMGRTASGAVKAMAVRPLTLDIENLATKTAIAAQKQQLFNQLLKQGSTNLLNFGKNTQWAGRQLMVGFTIPLTMLGSQAAKSFMALEKQALRFKRVYGEMFTTTEQTEKALKDIEMLAKQFTKYGVAVEKTMEIAADAAATGKMGADLMAQVAEATRLAVLGGVEQQQALETTLSLTNAFGIAADQLASKINFLNAVENQTILSIEDLTVAIPKAGPVIKQLGGNVEDLAFFMTAMKEGGINASEGANALKSGLASLINPSDKASEMLEELGINIKGIVEANKGDVKGTVIGFAQALDTLDPLNRARAIEQLFGKFQFSRLSTLFQNVTKGSTQAARALNLTGASVEELAILSERELKKVEDATGTRFKKSIEDLKVRLVPLGEQFLKAITPIAEFFSKILNGFNGLSDGVKSGITKFIGIVGIIGPVFLMTFGLIANAIANTIKLFSTLRKGYFNLGGQSRILGNQTNYMSSEQIEAATVAASLDQAHSKLIQTFLMESKAAATLTQAYQRATAAAGVFARTNPGMIRPGFSGRPPRRFNKGGFVNRAGGTVPGTGNTDSVPAILTPGEFVVNKEATSKNKNLLQELNKGGYVRRLIGTAFKGQKQFLGMPSKNPAKAAERQTRQKQLDDIATETYKSPRAKGVPLTDPGKRVSPSSGHSFPSSSVGGIYERPDGSRVFVKPMVSEKAALAEMRATEIARDVHGLVAPKQKLILIKDPNDSTGHRRYFALESPLDAKIANMPKTFTKDEMIKQLVSSTLRGDKDLGIGNVGGKVLADVGTAGVFDRASGPKLEYSKTMPSMAEQAMVNLLGVKGGAKKFFAQTTASMAAKMSPKEYDAAVRGEINKVLPKLKKKIQTMNLTPEELPLYQSMVTRLENGLKTDWSKFQPIHAAALSKGGFVLRTDGSDDRAIRVGGVAGTALLHYDDATSKKDVPTHQEGRLKGYRKASGYLMLGDQGYNNLTNSASRGKSDLYKTLKLLPSPYPLTLQDAKASQVVIDSKISELEAKLNSGKKLNSSEKKLLRMLNVASVQLKNDFKNMPNDRLWRVGMAQRTAAATALAEGEKYPPPGPAYKRTFNAHLTASKGRTTTASIKKAYTTEIDKLWKKGVLEDKGMGGDKSREHGKKGTLHSRPKTPVEKFMSQILQKRAYRSIRGLTRVGTGPKGERGFIQNAVTRELVKRGYAVQRARAKGTQNFGEPETVPALVTPGEMVLNEKTTQQHGPALQYINSGGIIKMRGKGTMRNGLVPGIGNKDTVPMMLNEGSFVVNKKSTQKNRGFLNAIAMRAEGTPGPFDDIGVPVTPSPASSSSAGRTIGKAFLGVVKAGGRAVGNAIIAPTMREVEQDLREIDREHEIKMREMQNKFSKASDDIEKTGSVSRTTTSTTSTARGDAMRRRAEAAFVSTGFYRNQNEKNKATAREAKLYKQERGRQFGQRAGGAMMGASMAVGALSMAPGKTGEIAQAAMPIVGMASLLAPMIGTKAGLIAAPIAAFTAAMVALNIQFNKAQDAALKLGEATGTSTKAIQSFAEFAGRVTGTELMDRRREAAKTPFAIQSGKTTVGQAYVQSEAGKATIASFQEMMKKPINQGGGREQAQKNLQAQLGTSILSGALSADEASSIAANIGLQMGDVSIGVKVAGELQALYNTKGDDVLKTGVELRTTLMEQSSKKILGSKGSLQDLSKNTAGFRGMDRKANIGSQVVAGAALGAVVGSFVPGIGNVVGGLVGATVGGIVGGVSAYFTNKNNVKRIGALSGAAVADAVGMFEQSRQLLDSYEQQYQAKRRQLLVENKIAEAAELQRDYEEGRLKITQVQEKQRSSFAKDYAGTRGAAREAFDKGLVKTAKTRYKGTSEEAYVDASYQTITDSVGKGITEADAGNLRAAISSGELGPSGVMSLLNTVTETKDRQRAMQIFTKLGGDEVSAATGIMGMFNQDADQGLLKQMKTDFLIQLSTKSDKDAQPYIDMMQKFSALGGVIQLDTEMESIIKNPEEQKELTKDFQMIEDKKGKFDIKFLQEVDTRFGEGAADAEYLKSLTEDEQKVYTQAIRGVLAFGLETIINSPEYQAWLADPDTRTGGAQYANKGHSPQFLVNKYAESLGFATTEAGKAMGTIAKTTPTTPKTKKARDTTYDDMLKKIKLFQNANANAIGGIKEVRRLMESPGKTMKADGIANRLIKSDRFSSEFTDMIRGMSPEDLQKNMGKFGLVLKKGKLEFTKDARDINKILAFGISGERIAEGQEALKVLQRKISAVNILRKKGVDHENAMIIAQDDAVNMAIINGTLNEKQLNARIKATKKLTAAEKQYQKVQSIQLQDKTMRNAMTGDSMMEYFDLMVKANEAAFVRQKTEIDLIEEKNGYLLEQISYEETLVNKVYDKQIERLDAIYRIQEDINQSQRERFDIVQQIAAGDMAGAARAIQDARQREALAQIEKKRQAVEDQRKKALGGITADGKTREQIEKENLDNAEKMNRINLQAFDQLVKIREFITQLTNKTPEQLTAYSELAKAAEALGLDLNSLDVEGAINASVQGKAEAFLIMLSEKTNKLFDKILGTDKDTYLGKPPVSFDPVAMGRYLAGIGPMPTYPNVDQGQGNPVLDPNTDATKDNTGALDKNTLAITNWLPAGSGSGSGSGKKGKKGDKTKPDISVNPPTFVYGQGNPLFGVKPPADFSTITVGKGKKAKTITVPKSFGFSKGGLVPKYFASGGYGKGTDIIPAMLTPGEFVVRKSAVDSIGIDSMQSINNGQMPVSNSLYNYSVSVNVSSSNANPNDIARAVMNQIKQVDAQRIRSSR